jgi:hypothetical protein
MVADVVVGVELVVGGVELTTGGASLHDYNVIPMVDIVVYEMIHRYLCNSYDHSLSYFGSMFMISIYALVCYYKSRKHRGNDR